MKKVAANTQPQSDKRLIDLIMPVDESRDVGKPGHYTIRLDPTQHWQLLVVKAATKKSVNWLLGALISSNLDAAIEYYQQYQGELFSAWAAEADKVVYPVTPDATVGSTKPMEASQPNGVAIPDPDSGIQAQMTQEAIDETIQDIDRVLTPSSASMNNS